MECPIASQTKDQSFKISNPAYFYKILLKQLNKEAGSLG